MLLQNIQSDFVVDVDNQSDLEVLPYEVPNNKKFTFSQKYTIIITSIFHYTGFSPFCLKNIKPMSQKHQFIIQTNTIQKLFCSAIHMIVLVSSCLSIYNVFLKKGDLHSRKNSMLYVATSFGETFIPCYFVIYIWQADKGLSKLVQFNRTRQLDLSKVDHISVKTFRENWLAVVFPIFSVANGLAIALFSKKHLSSRNGSLLHDLISDFALALHTVTINSADVIFPVVTLLFRDKASQFLAKLHSSLNHKTNEDIILQEYLSLELYVNDLNEHFGMWILQFCFLTIPYYSISLLNIFHGSLPLLRGLIGMIYCFCTSFLLLKVASVGSQVSDL